jgi:hypothetical protein
MRLGCFAGKSLMEFTHHGCGQKVILATTTNHIIARWNIDEIVLWHWILQRRRDLLKN